jgi:hypothetical protein
MKIAISIPAYFRPRGLRRIIESVHRENSEIEPIIIIDEDDVESLAIAQEFHTTYEVVPAKTLAPIKWNLALSFQPDYDAYILGTDDIEFLPGWWQAVKSALVKIRFSGVVGFNDHFFDGNFQGWATHYLATRDFIIKHCGGVLYPPCYQHYCGDPEVGLRATAIHKFIWARDAHILHKIMDGDQEWRTNWDDTWSDENLAASNVGPIFSQDFALHKERKKLGWPNTWEPAIW